MSQLTVWKSLLNQTKSWKVIVIALRHIEQIEKKAQPEGHAPR